jgi:hypothetical protein
VANENETPPPRPRIEWQEAWGPAFQRVLLSIGAVDKFMKASPQKR